MNSYRNYKNLLVENERLEIIAITLFCLLILFIIRNWYNLSKKKSFRKKNEQLKNQIDTTKIKIKNYDESLKSIKKLENTIDNKQYAIVSLKHQIEESNKSYFATLSEKENKITQQKESIDHQQKAYERYVNFKNVEANNTRLGAHFIKNVISQIYQDLEDVETSYKSFWGIQYKREKVKLKIPSIKALKNIFKLLDYNVSALNNESTSIENELEHINMFLELINYLKPNAKTQLNNWLNKEQNNTIKIKPTLFFPFVENALKHGNLNDVNSFISIDLKENEQKQISYCLINSAEQKPTANSNKNSVSKFGLRALKQLIDAYYPGSKIEHTILPNKQYMSQLILTIKK